MLKLQDLAERPDLQLGPILVSPSRRLVQGPAGEANVEPLIMQVLLLLIDARGRVVTRNELFDQCWGGVYVGDDSLNRAIAKVRRVAEAVAPGLVEIETIPRTGYRLTGDILDAGSPADGEGRWPAELQGLSRRTLVAGGAAIVAAGSLAGWFAWRARQDVRFDQLVQEADQVLRLEYATGKWAAIPLLEQAIAIDPDDPAALGLLAYAHAVRSTNDGPQRSEDIRAAENAINAALAADRNHPNTRLAVLVFYAGTFDWAATEAELRSILRTAPRNRIALSRLASLYQQAGLLRLSWNVLNALIALDPLSPIARFRRALQLWVFGRTDESYRLIERLIRIWPDHPLVWNARFLIFAFTGRAHAALDMIEDAASRPATITAGRMAQWRPTLLALERPGPSTIAAAREANLAAARQSPGQAAYAVMALGGIGEIDAAFEVAEGFLLSRGRIVTRRPTDRRNMLVNSPGWRATQWLWTPPLAAFRADPRFIGLCEGIGLTEYWRKRGTRPDYQIRPLP